MKKISYIMALFVVCLSKTVFATDIVVEEFGLFPTYPSITDAVAAAVDGDRIIIKNRAGNIPWIENITVAKALEFLPYDNDTFFVVQGNYTINIASGKTVTIIGMNNLVGSVTTSSAPSGSKVSTINIMGSWFQSGNVALGSSGYGVNVVNDKFDNGSVTLCYGEVMGCYIINSNPIHTISVYSGSTVLNDTVFVIGNTVFQTSPSYDGIYWGSTTSRFSIKNNFITHRNFGMEFNGAANGNSYIYNNTILAVNSSSSTFGIYVSAIGSGDVCEIMNNVIDANTTGTTYGIYNGGGNSGTVNVYYNHVDLSFNLFISSFTFVGNNTTTASVLLQSDGRLQAGSTAVNNGNPAAPYYDLDLSAGDPGAYGGSFTIDNFFPVHYGAARVYLDQYPFNIRQGTTLNIKAKSYDR